MWRAEAIPERRHPSELRRRPGRPLAFDEVAHRRRNVVEERVNWLKQWRAAGSCPDR